MSPPAVQVQALGYTYPDGHAALHGLSFSVASGESVALIGSNGAGKSTLLRHLNGILLATHGSVHISGVAVQAHTLAQIRRSVGLVFQNADDQLFMGTVAEDVAFGPQNMGLSAAEVARRTQAALATVGAAHLAARAPYRLSGGEKRAVAIAGVLAMAPEVLVMDEPTDGLDPAARRRLIQLLQGLSHTRIIATHDLDLVLALCPRALVLHEGRVAADGRPQDLFADADLLRRCQLEPPPGWPPGAGTA